MQARRQLGIMPAAFNDKAVEKIMLWFKNLMVYRLSRDVALRAEEMENSLPHYRLLRAVVRIWRKPGGFHRWAHTATR